MSRGQGCRWTSCIAQGRPHYKGLSNSPAPQIPIVLRLRSLFCDQVSPHIGLWLWRQTHERLPINTSTTCYSLNILYKETELPFSLWTDRDNSSKLYYPRNSLHFFKVLPELGAGERGVGVILQRKLPRLERSRQWRSFSSGGVTETLPGATGGRHSFSRLGISPNSALKTTGKPILMYSFFCAPFLHVTG